MGWLRRAWHLCWNVFRKENREQELDREIRAYADLLADERIAQGQAEAEARRSINVEVGGLEQLKEEVRAKRSGAALDSLLQDIRYGARMLRKKPGFTMVAVGTLALGIGANTAIFSVVDATLLTPIPLPDPNRVVMVWTDSPARGYHNFPASVPDFLDWKASGIFEQLAAFDNDGFNIRIGNRTERLEGLLVSPAWFVIQGDRPMLGRTFDETETRPGHDQVVVLGWDFWTSRYHGDNSVIGRSLIVNGTPHTVIGVLRKETPRYEHEQLYVPAMFDGAAAEARGTRSWLVVGRLASGVSLAAAQQRMAALNQRLGRQYPHEDGGQTLRLEPIEETYVQDVKVLLLVLFGAVGFVLLIACANIANLLLARGTGRRKEMAIRIALGASRQRIFCQLLSESVLLALLGASAGILPAFGGIRLIPKLGQELPNSDLISLNSTVLLFAFGLALVSGVLFGLLPALQFRKADTVQPLRQAERGQVSRRQKRLGNLFVVAQIAFTLVLLTGAGLMLRSFVEVRSHFPGYDDRQALKMDIALTGLEFRDPKKQAVFLKQALEALARLPGVESAGATDAIPGGDSFHGSGLHFTDRPEPSRSDVPLVLTASVSPDYFRSMRIALRKGRFFDRQDDESAPPVVIVDEFAAKKYWPYRNVIGQMVKLERTGQARRVVGVVGVVEQNGELKAAMGEVGQVYMPLLQAPKSGVSLVVRSRAEPSVIIPAIRGAIANLDRDVPLYRIQTLGEVRAEGQGTTRLGTELLGSFGAIALLLASMGVFGVMSYTVQERRREFGIRAAIGANTWDLLRLAISRGAGLVALGSVLGLVGAAGLTRLMGNLLAGVGPNDPLTFAAATLLLMFIGLLASYLPARHASRADPTAALRSE